MPDWTAPFHAPKFTDDQFEKAHDAYVKKNGYSITLPSLDDIIHINRPAPMTPAEEILWKLKRYNEIPPARLVELRAVKEKKRAKYLAALASPSPEWLRSAGAILTALDDAQDAISTLACIGAITAAVAGGTAAALLAGPVGWLMGTSALLSLLNPLSRIKGIAGGAKTGRTSKRALEKFTDSNPFDKKARVRAAKKLAKFRPGIPNVIEALQVTDQIFGVGISIGPIMGFAQDLASGFVRQLGGAKVDMRTTPPTYPGHVRKALKCLKTQTVMHGVTWESDLTDEASSMIAANLSLQVIEPYNIAWNPLDNVSDIANVILQCPQPTDILSLEIIRESGRSLADVCNWPQNGQPEITLGDLQEATAPKATKNLQHFGQANKNDPLACIAGQNAHNFALGAMEAIEGPNSVEVVYPSSERIVLIILGQGWCYPDDITDAQIRKFEEWIYVHDHMGTMPTYKDIYRYAQDFCGFTWSKSPDED